MRCFNHHERDAVGICKACGKGLCSECAVDLKHGIACRNLHEPDVDALQAITLRAGQMQSVSRQARFAAPVFYLAAGAIFLGFGLFNDQLGFATFLGGAIMIYGVYVLRANLRAYRQRAPDV